MLHELRIYTCLPGKLPLLLKRFESVTLALWARHGIQQAGFWTTVIGESNTQLIYLIAWESLADRERKWTAFQTDPEWIANRNASEKDGMIIANVSSQILAPTAFSSIK
jgi:NIPSNAP